MMDRWGTSFSNTYGTVPLEWGTHAMTLLDHKKKKEKKMPWFFYVLYFTRYSSSFSTPCQKNRELPQLPDMILQTFFASLLTVKTLLNMGCNQLCIQEFNQFEILLQGPSHFFFLKLHIKNSEPFPSCKSSIRVKEHVALYGSTCAHFILD